jgi:hypothetical protein
VVRPSTQLLGLHVTADTIEECNAETIRIVPRRIRESIGPLRVLVEREGPLLRNRVVARRDKWSNSTERKPVEWMKVSKKAPSSSAAA